MKGAALAVLLVACGDNLPDPGTPHSGQRLKLAWWEWHDGPRQRETSWYYDDVLDVRCVPTEFSDGNRYCAPPAAEAVYVSDTCTRALGRVPIGGSAQFAATQFYRNGKVRPSRVFQTGATTLAPVSIWQNIDNVCIGPMEPGDTFEYFELGREVTSLVRLRHSDPRGDGSLAIVDEVSDDGLRVPIGYYDSTLEVECTPEERWNVESIVCVPNDAPLASYFHEVGCLEPELAVVDGSFPTTAKQYSPLTRCWSYYDVGDEVAAPPLYESLSGLSCVPVSPPAGGRFFLMGGPQQLQGMLRKREMTSHRLAAIDRVRMNDAEELRVADPFLFDRELGTECRRNDDARCLPITEATVESFFADSGCTTRLDLAIVPAGSCDSWTPFARGHDALYPLVAEYTKTIFWISTGDTCGIYGPPTSFVAWTIGPAIDPSTFAQAQLTIDP